jgi:hypothetical protein
MRGALSHARIRPGNTGPAIPSAAKSPFAPVYEYSSSWARASGSAGTSAAAHPLPTLLSFLRAHFPRFTLSLMNYLWRFLTAPLLTRPRSRFDLVKSARRSSVQMGR